MNLYANKQGWVIGPEDTVITEGDRVLTIKPPAPLGADGKEIPAVEEAEFLKLSGESGAAEIAAAKAGEGDGIAFDFDAEFAKQEAGRG